jgi:peptidoglycan-N-acetylglucosamine deacetylase
VRRLLYIIANLPWAFVMLFCIASFTALGMTFALLSAGPGYGAAGSVKRNDGTKRIAISFDDSPRGPGAFLDTGVRPQMLRAALKRAGVKQAAFFSNPGRAPADSSHEAELRAYAKAGHVLANHTATHIAASRTTPDRFLSDIDDAEKWLKPERGYRPWFRFPELDEGGKDFAKRDEIRAGLKARGLRHGYVTADGWDWYLEGLARKALKAGKRLDHDALRSLYVETHVMSAQFADNLTQRVLGRRAAQMLLLHETDLAALYLEDLVKALRKDGWTIITTDEAYADPMGKLPLPEVAFANGTIIQMLAWDRKTKGPRWYERNERDVVTKLFNERVLHVK